MPYEFEKFPGAGRGFSARASIRKNGQLGFNQGAIIHCDITEYDNATLHYDRRNQVIGVQLMKDADDPAACKFVHRPGNSYIAAKSFFDYFGIQYAARTRRFDLQWDEDSGMLIIDLQRQLGEKMDSKSLDM